MDWRTKSIEIVYIVRYRRSDATLAMSMKGMEITYDTKKGFVEIGSGFFYSKVDPDTDYQNFEEASFDLNLDDWILYDLYIVQNEDSGEYHYHLDESFLNEVETPSYSGEEKLIHRFLTIEIYHGEVLEENIHYLK